MATKTDAKNQKLTYAYDSYNRLTTVTLSPSTVLRTYYYDTMPTSMDPNQTFLQYGAGRLTAVQYPAAIYTPIINGISEPAQAGAQMNDMYSYTQAGQVATKRLQVTEPFTYQDQHGNHNTSATANLDSTYAYNTEGKITSMSYPGTGYSSGLTAGPSYNYSYDSMYRLSGMTSSGTTIVNGVSYNAANQLLGMTFNTEVETRGTIR